jgi:hypothetical protein
MLLANVAIRANECPLYEAEIILDAVGVDSLFGNAPRIPSQLVLNRIMRCELFLRPRGRFRSSVIVLGSGEMICGRLGGDFCLKRASRVFSRRWADTADSGGRSIVLRNGVLTSGLRSGHIQWRDVGASRQELSGRTKRGSHALTKTSRRNRAIPPEPALFTNSLCRG